MTTYYGVNKSRINILGIFKTNCTVNEVSTKLTFLVVPKKTITFSAILGRDYIVPHRKEVSSLIVNDKKEHVNEIEQTEKSNIFQIDCVNNENI